MKLDQTNHAMDHRIKYHVLVGSKLLCPAEEDLCVSYSVSVYAQYDILSGTPTWLNPKLIQDCSSVTQ